VSEQRDEHRDDVKAAFVRNPQSLLAALGLRIDDRKSKGGNGQSLWCFSGAEQDASLQIGGRPGMEGMCKFYNRPDEKATDCFGLVESIRGCDFPAALEYTAGIYGVTKRDAAPQARAKKVVTGRATYQVTAPCGAVVQHRRLDFEDGGKMLWWQDAQGTKVDDKYTLPEGVDLHDLPLWRSELLAEFPTRPVFICEGEKDADAICSHGGLALGTYGADVIPSKVALAPLVGRKVILWPDNDAAGRRHMEAIARKLAGMGHHCYVLEWQDAEPKAGASDWFALGLTVDGIRDLVAQAKPWALVFGEEDKQEQVVAAAVNAVPTYTPPQEIIRGARPVSEIADEVITRLEERRALPRAIYGMRSGWKTLDWWYLGFKWEGLVVVSGATGSGKTTVARHFMFASSEAILRDRSDERLLFYFCEGGRDQLLRRYASWQHGIPWQLLSPGSEAHMTPEWEQRLVNTYSEFPNLPIDLCDNTSDAWEIMGDIRQRAAEGPIGGVVIDNIQLLTYKGGSDYSNNKAAALEALSLADTLEVPIFVLSQVNRDGASWKNRGGPEWGQNATCAFYVRRGERGTPTEEENASNVTTLHNTKRRGEGGVLPGLKLIGDPGTGRLYEEPEWIAMQEHERSRTPAEQWAGNQ
jgi:hypothetical protein